MGSPKPLWLQPSSTRVVSVRGVHLVCVRAVTNSVGPMRGSALSVDRESFCCSFIHAYDAHVTYGPLCREAVLVAGSVPLGCFAMRDDRSCQLCSAAWKMRCSMSVGCLGAQRLLRVTYWDTWGVTDEKPVVPTLRLYAQVCAGPPCSECSGPT